MVFGKVIRAEYFLVPRRLAAKSVKARCITRKPARSAIWKGYKHKLPILDISGHFSSCFYLLRSEQVKVWCIDQKNIFGAEGPVLYFTNRASFLGAKGRPTLCPRIFGGRGSIVMPTVLIFPCPSAPQNFFQQVPNGPNYGAEGQAVDPLPPSLSPLSPSLSLHPSLLSPSLLSPH